jgi:transposase
MNILLTELLNLPGVIVEDWQQTETELILCVEMDADYATCPSCGQVSKHLHANTSYWVRDLPLSNREVWLKVNRRRFKCFKCEKPFSEELFFVGRRKKYTHRYASKITAQVIHSDVHNIAEINQLTDEEVWSMVNHVAAERGAIDVSQLKRLGIDEISLVKGGGLFIVVLVDLDSRKLVGLAKQRKQSEIEKVMRSWGESVLSQIEEVSLDLCVVYKSLVEKICPNAVITADRFHVMKLINEELNSARIQQKKTAEALETKERAKLFGSLKGSKYILLKTEESLSEKQKEKLSILKEASPYLGRMHDLKEEFINLFDLSKNLGEGTLKLLDWLESAQGFFRKTVPTIKRWFAEIVGYFERRTTNGVVEGINNKLKLLKRSGFNFRNFDNFELRALLYWHFP